MSSDATMFAPPITMRQDERSGDGSRVVSYGMDSQLLVEFYSEPIHMEWLSNQAGHPIYQERIFTRIVVPGNRNTVVVHQTKGIKYEQFQDPDTKEYVTNWDIMNAQDNGDPVEPEKYPNAWNRFLKKGLSATSGHPIEEWGSVTRSYAMSLKAQNIHTVEALASLSDSSAQNVMGGLKYRDLAKAHLDQRERDKIIAAEQEKASQWAETASVLKKQVEALQEEVMRMRAMQNGPEGQDPRLQSQGVAVQMGEFSAAQGIKKMTRQEANKRHQLPQGKPGEA